MAKMQKTLGQTGAKKSGGPIKVTSKTPTARTHEGGAAFTRDAKSELFLLGVVNMVSENTFYESATSRDERFENLVHQVTTEDPTWVQGFVGWLRNSANMRSASLVAAAEYVFAGGPNGRKVIDSAIVRADEPAEMLAYWIARHGRRIPQPVKRGVADAAARLYNERNVLKWDSSGASVRMADVVQLAHVKPRADWQGSLFSYLLGERFSNDTQITEALSGLSMLRLNRELRSLDQAAARARLLSEPETLAGAGMTWESLSSFGPMDSAAWEAVIPQMGYMALLRNLRNFDEKGVSEDVADSVIAKLSDPDEVRRSRQFPFRFWSAYKAAPSDRWKRALERALDTAVENVPTFTGKTLILLDTSASMSGGYLSERGTIAPVEAGAVFAGALMKRNPGTARLVQFASTAQDVPPVKGESALRTVNRIMRLIGQVGHGTDIQSGLNKWNGEDRVVLITDMQTSTYTSRSRGAASRIPSKVPIYGFNLGGYKTTVLASGQDANEYEFGGLNDKTFSMISLIEQSKNADKWPWE